MQYCTLCVLHVSAQMNNSLQCPYDAGRYSGHCAHAYPAAVPIGALCSGGGPCFLVGLCGCLPVQLRYSTVGAYQSSMNAAAESRDVNVLARCCCHHRLSHSSQLP